MADPFPTTSWSLVVRARGEDTAAHEALSALCSAYWYPLYVYVRHREFSKDDACDLVQGYFAQLLERRFDGRARPEAGRFRAFLLHTLKQYLASARERARAQKRGSGRALLELDVDTAEGRYDTLLVDSRTPEREFERQWALTVIDRVLDRLRSEARRSDKLDEFDALKAFLTEPAQHGSYREVGERLGLREGAVKTAVHRLRRRFGNALRAEISETVDDESDVETEIRDLFDALAP